MKWQRETSPHSPSPTYLSQTSAFVGTIYWLLVLSTWFKDASLSVNSRDVYGVKPDTGAREMTQTPLRAPAILQHP